MGAVVPSGLGLRLRGWSPGWAGDDRCNVAAGAAPVPSDDSITDWIRGLWVLEVDP
jgi:hypothetical protein